MPTRTARTLLRGAASAYRCLYYRSLGAKIGARCSIRRIEIPRNAWDIWIHDHVGLDSGVVLLASGARGDQRRIIIHRGCYINRYTMIDAAERIEIGPDCMIGPHCYVTDHDHGMKRGIPIGHQPLRSAPTAIGTAVWIGAGVSILKGVSIGDGAVIGAGAVVTRNVAAHAIAAGVPATVIGERT